MEIFKIKSTINQKNLKLNGQAKKSQNIIKSQIMSRKIKFKYKKVIK